MKSFNYRVTQYSKATKILHWFIAVVVLLMLTSFFLGQVQEKYQSTAYLIHKSMGLTVLFLMLVRIAWIFYTGRPDLPRQTPRWERYLSRGVQYSFYVLLILMPLSGWIMSTASQHSPNYFGLIQLPFPGVPINKALAKWMAHWHERFAWTLLVLAILHIAGAIKHAICDKDDVLQKML